MEDTPAIRVRAAGLALSPRNRVNNGLIIRCDILTKCHKFREIANLYRLQSSIRYTTVTLRAISHLSPPQGVK